MARTALGLSVVAFIPPLGIAALVLGHMAEHRIAASEKSSISEQPVARAALWIAYLQLALLSAMALFLWSAFHDTAQEFQRDPLVQRFLRESAALKPLDPQSARDAESTAQNIVYQLIAINEQVRRASEDGAYACQINQLIQTGLEGTSDAERRALYIRLQESPYMYGISNCNPSVKGTTNAAYILTAVPVPPRMPENSALFCTDQTGVVLSVRGGTSVDCFKNGQAVR